MKLIISHFFNEEYLLPWWLKHHRDRFDHGILIDYHSTDRSVEICRELVPGWDIVTSENHQFAALKCDFEVMKHEARYPDAWKIALNTTEFLAGDVLDQVIAAAEHEGRPGVYIPGTAMVDDQPQTAPDPAKPLIAQKYHGFWESEFPVTEVHFPWFFPRARTRLLHRQAFGAYTPGRHSSMLPGLVEVPNTELGIWWYGYSPWTEDFIARKAQIQTKMDPMDKKAGFGMQHLASYAEQRARHAALLPFAHDLDPGFTRSRLRAAPGGTGPQDAGGLFTAPVHVDPMLLQRDAAFAQRDAAIAERDEALRSRRHARKYPWKYFGTAFRMHLDQFMAKRKT